MQKDDFNDILKHHASGFEIRPASSFDKVMERRAAARNRKRVMIWAVAATFFVVTGVFFGSMLMPDAVQQDLAVYQPSSEQILPETYTSEHVQKSIPENADINQQSITEDNHRATVYAGRDNQEEPVSGKPQTKQAIPLPAFDHVGSKPEADRSGLAKRSIRSAVAAAQASAGRVSPQGNDLPVNAAPVDAPEKNTLNKATAAEGEKKNSGTVSLVTTTPESPVSSPEKTVTTAIAEIQPAAADSAVKPVSFTAIQDSVIAPVMPASHTVKPNWNITVLFTPQLVNSVYNANSGASLSWMKQYLENREQNDKAVYSLNAGLKVERRLSNRLSISAGVLYSVVKFEEIRLANIIVRDTLSQNLGTSYETDQVKEVNRNSFDISFSSLEIPVQVYYTLEHKKMFYQVTAGAAYSYLFKTRSLVFNVNDSLNIHETDDAGNKRLQQHNVLLIGGLHAGYRFNKRWSVYMGPVFRYSLNSIYSKDYIIRQQPYYIGIEMGLKFSF